MSDSLRELCVKQGYVSEGCKLDGQLVLLLTKQGEDPCAGCNENRSVCKGRPKKN